MSKYLLKCDAPFFDAIEKGEKTFELRFNDRGYQKGDTLTLRRMDGAYWSGEALDLNVKYVFSGKPWLADGYVCMSIETIPAPPKEKK